jgi:hypothetical protein
MALFCMFELIQYIFNKLYTMTCTFTDVQWQSWNTWSCMDVSSERSSRSRALYIWLYMVSWEGSKNILYSYSVCRFLKTEKITYYIDILRGFSVKTKQHIKLIIILRVSILRTKERHWYRAYSMHSMLLYIAWFLKWTKQQHIILIYCVV